MLLILGTGERCLDLLVQGLLGVCDARLPSRLMSRRISVYVLYRVVAWELQKKNCGGGWREGGLPAVGVFYTTCAPWEGVWSVLTVGVLSLTESDSEFFEGTRT